MEGEVWRQMEDKEEEEEETKTRELIMEMKFGFQLHTLMVKKNDTNPSIFSMYFVIYLSIYLFIYLSN